MKKAQEQPDIKELLGEKFGNAEYFRRFFECKGLNGVYVRMRAWNIAGQKFGNRQKYWSLSAVAKKLAR